MMLGEALKQVNGATASNVRDFINKNYTAYNGDASFLPLPLLHSLLSQDGLGNRIR